MQVYAIDRADNGVGKRAYILYKKSTSPFEESRYKCYVNDLLSYYTLTKNIKYLTYRKV